MEQEIDIKIQAAIDAVDASKTLGELRKSIKDLKSLALEAEEGSKAFDTLTSKIGQTEDRLKDLNEVVAMKTGSDVENLAKSFAKFGSYGATSLQTVTGAMGLFGNQSEETMKQLVKLQAAFNFANGIKALVEGFDEVKKSFSILMTTMKSMMASNPFGLILIAITSVIGALFLLRNHIKPIGDMFEAIGVVIKKIIQAVKDFSDAIGLTNFAVKDSVEKNIKQFKKEQDALEKSLDEQIKVRKAQGKKSVDLDSALLLSKIKHTDDVIKQYDRIIASGEKLNKEQQKLYDESITNAKKYTTELLVIFETSNKEQEDLLKNYAIEAIRLQMELNGTSIGNMTTNANLEKEITKLKYEDQRKQMEANYYAQLKNMNELYKQNKISLDKILQYQKDYAKSVNDVYNNYNLQLKVIEKKTSAEIINERKRRNEELKKIEKEAYTSSIEVEEIKLTEQEKIFNRSYDLLLIKQQTIFEKLLQDGKDNFEERREQGEDFMRLFTETLNKISDTTSLVAGESFEKEYIRTQEQVTKLYDTTKEGLDKELVILKENRDKITDINSNAYKIAYNNVVKKEKEITDLTETYNKTRADIQIKYDNFANEAKKGSIEYIIGLEEKGLNRTSILYNLRMTLNDTNNKIEMNNLRAQYQNKLITWDEYEALSTKAYLNYERNKVLITSEAGDDINNINKDISNKEIVWRNKTSSFIGKILNVDLTKINKAYKETLDNISTSRNEELESTINYYDTRIALVEKGSLEEQELIERKAKAIFDINEKYRNMEKEATDEAVALIYEKQVNSIGQYFSAMQNLFSNISALVEQISEQQIAAAEEVMNKQIEAIDATTNAQIAAAERDITDTVALEEAKKNITDNAITRTLAAKNKYAKEENKLKSKQFKVEKASNMVKATMDGIMAVMQALASAPPPYNAILAAISGAAAAVNIGMLASTKPPKELEGADVSGGSFTSPYTGGSGSSSSSSSSPNVNAAAFYKLGQGGPNILSQQNGGMDNKVYVVESDIRQTSGRVETIERRAGKSL